MQLVRVNNTIGIKLRQGKLLEGAIIEKESNTWKELDWNELRTRNFNDVTNSMQLDDVVLPPHHVVGGKSVVFVKLIILLVHKAHNNINYVATGVRLMWAANKYGFRIEVLGVPYNAITGKLEIWTPVWYNSEGNADVAKLPEAVKRYVINIFFLCIVSMIRNIYFAGKKYHNGRLTAQLTPTILKWLRVQINLLNLIIQVWKKIWDKRWYRYWMHNHLRLIQADHYAELDYFIMLLSVTMAVTLRQNYFPIRK